MDVRILICVCTHNRKPVVEQCLPTLVASKYEQDEIRCYNDGSTEYGPDFLKSLGADWAQDCVRCGPDAQRRMHILDFLPLTQFSHLAFMDSDVICDPHWRERMLEIHNRTGALTCGYNSPTHEAYHKNTFGHEPGIVWRRFAPGVAWLLSRQQVEKIAPLFPEKANFDWLIPGILGYRCATSDTSCVDHIGFQGQHDEMTKPGYASKERALNPTPWLVQKRAEVLANLGLRDE